MISRRLVAFAISLAVTSLAATASARAQDRHVLHHCEDVLAHAAKTAHSTKALRADPIEVERCRMVIREFVSRESRMTVDQNGRQVR